MLFSVNVVSCFGLFDIARETQYMYIVSVNITIICIDCETGQKRSLNAYILRQYTYIVHLCLKHIIDKTNKNYH
jgi:hypothetical protein